MEHVIIYLYVAGFIGTGPMFYGRGPMRGVHYLMGIAWPIAVPGCLLVALYRRMV